MTLTPPTPNRPQRIAVLLADGFEDFEFQVPCAALKQAGAEVVVLGRRMNETYTGKQGKLSVKPDATTTEVLSDDFDAILIPGGHAPDRVRCNARAVRLVTDAMAQHKLVAAICHGPQVLIETDQLPGRQVTGARAIRKDLINAGATYLDQPVVEDGPLITARRPSDLPLFATRLLAYLGLTGDGEALPINPPPGYEWWGLGSRWGGSTRQDILQVINTALVGERYTLAAFRKYCERVNDVEAQEVLDAVITAKALHVEQLEVRLRQFDETVTWQAMGSEAFATLQSWLQSSDEADILRQALGDLQTGAGDARRFANQLTDPITCDRLDRIAATLNQLEERLGNLYRTRLGSQVEAPLPTTLAVG